MSNTAQSLASKELLLYLMRTVLLKSAAVSQPETQISTYLKRKHRQTVSSPVTVSLTAAWCMCTARMLPF